MKNNVFTEEANKFSLSSDKIKEGNQLIWQKHSYGTRKDLVLKKEEIKCYNLIKQ